MCSMRRSSRATGQPGRYVYGTSAAVTADTVPTKARGVADGGVGAGADGPGTYDGTSAGRVVGAMTPMPEDRFAARVADVVVQPARAHAVTTTAATRAPRRAMNAYGSPADWRTERWDVSSRREHDVARRRRGRGSI